MQLPRLRDLQDPVAPELAAARDLLRTTGPLEPSLARMQRVRQALLAGGPPVAPAGTSLLVKAVLLVLAAGVTAGLFFLTRGSRQPRSEPPARRPPISLPSTAVVSPLPAPAGAHAAEPLQVPVPPVHLGGKDYRRQGAAGQPGISAVAPPAVSAVTQHKIAAVAKHEIAAVSPPEIAAVSPLAASAVAPPKLAAVSPPAASAIAPPASTEKVPAIIPSGPVGVPDPAVEVPEEVDPAEASLVLSATQVLRQRGEPARALVLLNDYQSRFPKGALQEEALALNLECLVALADERAGAQAREYLKRYPRGRFRTFAAATAARYPASRPLKE
ncbi:MAG TPA: hypothetical protein PLW65_00990 [Pseudomonadota bacterium]|nr:hypothetical protein [Pseudomonadota bacterium]